MDPVKIIVDGQEVVTSKGKTVIQAAAEAGVSIPHYCYHPKLSIAGNCRMCMVEIEKMPKLQIACNTQVTEGMSILTQSAKVVAVRKAVLEFLLINHPVDCPICDQAGECHLQDLSYEHGKVGTRYQFARRTFVREDIGPYIQLHMTRCILCYRCTYVADQITDKRVHGIVDRGDHAAISTYISRAIENDFSGNMIDVCPVGALTDRTFRFKNRVWFTKPMDAHRNCENPKCCGKVTLWMRGEEVYRVTARKDPWGEVQSYDGKPGWICNTCRFDKKKASDWIIEGVTPISRHSVIGLNKYETLVTPKETIREVMGGLSPNLLMNIHSVSDVNDPDLRLSEIDRPADGQDFDEADRIDNNVPENPGDAEKINRDILNTTTKEN
ncbi:MAG: 2Fe-2S iron-sulfur cluster-binding protein [Candidatus Binatia bacterium]